MVPSVPASPPPAPATRGRLDLPRPEALPRTRADLAQAVATVRGAPGFFSSLASAPGRAALRALWQAEEPAPASRAGRALRGEAKRSEADHEEHDRYFGVTRVDAEPGHAFVRGMLRAHLELDEDARAMGVTLLDAEAWETLFGGVRAMLELALGAPWDEAEHTAPFPGRAPRWRPAGYDPDRRWMVGHRLFFAQIQAVVVGLHVFEEGAGAGDAVGARDGLRLATAFMRSSAVAMKHTSDFDPADYDARVRPAMAPPRVQAGFSGLQTRDHTFLVRTFTRLRPLFAAGGSWADAHRAFVDSVVDAYAAHEFVCARFRGDVLPSLRMAAHAGGQVDRSGVDVVREMMRARLLLVEPKHG
jgi:hypothetical protein